MTDEIKVTVPRLLGTRESAQELMQDVNPECSTTVVIDFSQNVSAAQGSCDEIVRQLIQKEACRVLFIQVDERAQEYLLRAKTLRASQGTFISAFC